MSGDTIGPVERAVVNAVVYAIWGGLGGLYLGFGLSDAPFGRMALGAAVGAVVGVLVAASEYVNSMRPPTRKPATKVGLVGGLGVLLLLPLIQCAIERRSIRLFDLGLPVVLGIGVIRDYRRRRA